VTRKTPTAFWKTLHRIADRRIGATERTFLDAIHTTLAQVNRSALRAAIDRGDAWGIARALGVEPLADRLDAIFTPLQQVYTAAGRASEAALGPRIDISFQVVNPYTLPWVRVRTAELVTLVTDDVKDNIRLILADKFRRGQTVAQAGRAIRAALRPDELLAQTEADAQWSVGLTGRQVQAVLNYRETLYDGQQFTNGEIDAATVEARADRYAAKLLRQRATMIARTETQKAAAAAQRDLWSDAVKQGFIDPQTARQTWIVTPDDKLCPVCEAIPILNPDGVPLGEPFDSDVGPVDGPGDPHPNCRCAVGLVFDEAAQEAA
jgi:hypothetical protein